MESPISGSVPKYGYGYVMDMLDQILLEEGAISEEKLNEYKLQSSIITDFIADRKGDTSIEVTFLKKDL